MQRAFSLIELSIVLVILGLLTGGILAGQSLVRAAELRAVTSEYHRYATATRTFRDQYFGLPGDITNATKFWGAIAGDASDNFTASCFATASTDARTCNGNGDGKITFTGVFTAPTFNEVFRFWQHMANAGLIDGQYSGISTASYYMGANKQNSPSSRLGRAIWVISYGTGTTYSLPQFFHHFNHHLIFGGPSSSSWNHQPLLKAEEAWNIDMKVDDGKPAAGKVMAGSPPPNPCTDGSSSTDTNASYMVSGTANCLLMFIDII